MREVTSEVGSSFLDLYVLGLGPIAQTPYDKNVITSKVSNGIVHISTVLGTILYKLHDCSL